MKIIRYLDAGGNEHYGAQETDGTAIELAGAPFSQLKLTNRPARISKLLAPLVPAQIFGIGLNYRRHAEETKAKIPEFPVLFGKGLNSLQNPRREPSIPMAPNPDAGAESGRSDSYSDASGQ